MSGWRERVRSSLRGVNPTVAAGIALLVAGVALSVVRLRPSPAGDAEASLRRALSALIQATQRAILWGDEAIGDPQSAFNSAVIALYVESLSPSQQEALASVATVAQALLGDFLSLAGFGTVAALAATYYAVARAFDARFSPGPGPP
jgi:hypothetical protein